MSYEQMAPMSPADARRQAKAEAAAAKARVKAQRPFWKKKRVIVPAAVVLLVGAIAISGGDDDDDDAQLVASAAADEDAAADADLASDEATNEATDDADEADEADGADEADAGDEADEVADGFGLGETIAMGDLEHTFHSARFSAGDEFLAPDDGTAWLVVDVELTNNGDESEAVSSLLMWDLVDAENRSQDRALSLDEQGSLEGELGPERSMRGEIAFEVAAEQSEWELIFEPHLLGFGQGIYAFSVDEVN